MNVTWTVAGVALGVRLLLVAAASPAPARLHLEPDSSEYERLALNLVRHGRFSLADAPPLVPDHTRTPMYPLVLAAVEATTGPNPVAAALAGAAAGAATAGLLSAVARHLLGPGPAVVGGLVLALDPTSAAYSALLLTEPLFTLLLTAGLLTFAGALASGAARPLGRAGLWLGLAALTRPIGAFLPLCLAGTYAARCRRRRSRAAAGLVLLLAGSAIVTLPWAIRNRLTGGPLGLSTVGPTTLYYHRAGAVLADAAGISREAARRQLAARLADELRHGGAVDRATEQLMTRSALAIIRADLPRYARLHAEGVGRMLGPSPEPLFLLLGWLGPDRRPVAGRASHWALATSLEATGLAVLYAAAAVGTWRALGSSKGWLAAPALVAVTYAVLLSGPEAYPRFRVPVMPALAWLAALGLPRAASGRPGTA